MYDKLEGYPEYQEFLSALLTLKLCQAFGGKLHVCVKRMKFRFTDENTLKFLKRVNKPLLDYTFKEFQESFK